MSEFRIEGTGGRKYKNTWKEYSVNEAFWDEALLGRTITETRYNDRGLIGAILDNGERLNFAEGGFSVESLALAPVIVETEELKQ